MKEMIENKSQLASFGLSERKKMKQEHYKALIMHSVILLTPLRLCALFSTVQSTTLIFQHFFFIRCTKYSYIHVLWVEISQNKYFVFGFMSLSVLTVFSTIILTGSWWRRTLTHNSITSNPCRYPHAKFQENRSKTVAVTVLPFFRQLWRSWRH